MSFVKRNYIDGETVITAENLNDIQDAIIQIVPDDVKQALLQIASKVAYIDEHGQDYYDALEVALYPDATLVSISAVYTQSGTVYDTDSLDSLKADLVVTATYSDSSTETVTAYTLSGTLTRGTSTITVTYGGKTTTFNVTVTLNTTAVIEQSDKTHNWSTTSKSFYVTSRTNAGITKKYDIPATNILYPAGVIVYGGTVIANDIGAIVTYDDNGTNKGEVSEKLHNDERWTKLYGSTYTEFSKSWTFSSGQYTKITFDLDMRYLDYSYMYDKTTGLVFFAGINTPYFGMENISEASS